MTACGGEATMDEATAVIALAALAQGMRLRVFRALVGAGPRGLTPGALAATLGVPGSTLSFHLKELMHAGLVSQQRDGRHLIYRPSLERMNALLAYLTAHCCQGAQAGERGEAGDALGHCPVATPGGCTTC
jgi:ArsR family transcriptional regulator, arsenate/arsenite/antimonite-responsive transcriptional repressor